MKAITRLVLAAKPPKNPVGTIVKSRFGEIIILSDRYMRTGKYEYKWCRLSELGSTKIGWIKLPMSADFFKLYPFIRLATPAEMKKGNAGLSQNVEQKYEQKKQAYNKIVTENIKPGDIVEVKYSNLSFPKKEIVLEVNYKAGKLAIVRMQGGEEWLTKKRYLPVSICTKVVDGGGKFDPKNPVYEKNHLYVPDFYKRGGTVAPRKTKRSYYF